MLAHSPKTSNLAAYASTCHSTAASPAIRTNSQASSSSMSSQQKNSVATSSAHHNAGGQHLTATVNGTQAQNALPLPCPDDSDFLESDADGEFCDGDDAHMMAGTSYGIASDRLGSPGSELDAQDVMPEIPLIYISNRLYFTYFSDPTPPAHVLNQQHGTRSAWFEASRARGAAAQEDELPSKFHWFNIDDDLVYLSFFEDWGPLNVALFYRFCMHIHQLLNDESMSDCVFVFFTSTHPHKKANGSLLASMYSMIIDHIEPADAFHPFSGIEFKPFRDAGYGRADYSLTLLDVLYGVHKAIKEKLLDLSEFNLEEYEFYEQVQCGDWNWITPNFLAFASPNDREYVASLKAAGGQLTSGAGARLGRKLPQVFVNTIRYFKERNVKLVVRLNNPLYDKAVFEEAGIAHLDLYFDDGSNPSESILREFIKRADDVVSKGGAIAVHCKAGLGRTGVLIGAYMVWKYGFSASEAIGFMRIMRPGCVVGPQQHFMYQNFIEWVRWSVRDQAMAMAQKTIQTERAQMAARGLIDVRRVPKRASSSDEEDEADEVEVSSVVAAIADNAGPTTPRATRPPRVVPATAAPAVKPVPCVGQPRKSPSPSRKRAANVARPAQVPAAALSAAPRQRTALTASSSINANELPRSASDENLSTTASKSSGLSRDLSRGPQTPNGGVAALRTSWEAIAGVAASHEPQSPPSRGSSIENVAVSTPRSGRVLSEAQRLNNVTPSRDGTPSTRHTTTGSAAKTANRADINASSKPSMTAERVTDQIQNVTSSEIRYAEKGQLGPRGHARAGSDGDAGVCSQNSDPDDVFGSSPQPSTPSRSGRVPSFKASPDVRAAYNLKDSKLPAPKSPRGESTAAMSSASDELSTEARTTNGMPKDGVRKTSHDPAGGSKALSTSTTSDSARLPATSRPNAAVRTMGRVPSSSNTISPAKVRGAAVRAAVTSALPIARPGQAPVARPTVAPVRPAVRTTSSGSASGTRPVGPSARLMATGAGSAATTARVGPGRNVSGSGKTATEAAPRSLTATSAVSAAVNGSNAAMLAARANLKRARQSPDLVPGAFERSNATSRLPSDNKPPVSSVTRSSRFGRNVRRRRSSLGEADIGMA